MSGDADSGGADEALRAALAPPEAPAVHAVHDQIARIASAFGATATDTTRASASASDEEDEVLSHLAAAISPATAAEACLLPALTAIGWAGVVRDVREVLPHFDRICDIEGLRSVLARLNYQTVPEPINLAEIRAEMMPCLFSEDGINVWVAVKRAPSGELLVFDGAARQLRLLPPPDVEGVAYTISSRTNEPAAPAGGAWLGNVIGHFRPLILKIFALSFLINLCALALPLFIIHVYDLGIGARAVEVVLYLGAGALIVMATDQVLRRVRGRALSYLGARLDAIIAMTTFQQLLQMPISMTDSVPVSTQISRLKQFENVRDAFTGTLAAAAIDIPFILVFLAAVTAIGGHLVWVPLTLVVAYAVMAIVSIPLSRRYLARTSDAKIRLQNLLVELVRKRQAIRDLHAEQIWIARHDALANLFVRRSYSEQIVDGFVQSLAQSMVTVAGISTLGAGTLMVIGGSLSTGQLIGVMVLVWRILSPLQSLFFALTRLQQTIQTFKQINRLMEIAVERNPDQRVSFYRKFKGGISLNRLVFRYPRNMDATLRGMQFQIKPGEAIAIAGKSGSGKSTLLKVIAGLYNATGGAVLADGLDIRQLDPAEWRSGIAYASQTSAFFQGTVAQNIRLACPQASDEEIARAAAEMGLDRYPDLFPDGLDTRLSRSAIEQLPPAVRRRLQLARCFVKQASLYVLDSPFVNLDGAGEAILEGKIRALKGQATVIFTSHKPQRMRVADRIIVLESGQIAMHGPADKVIERLAAAA
jgi:ABC-type bacteriocin/lantibiotic exporter with double-glycine peptidase domain